eukprot:TRINITY_DN1976_c0_g2_i3.p1 TRINITY_DN1976_c0_g2~~TRINITY_DN1976_c0_g2_i3.p1  ORF type:complete len:1074 (-),score=203.93 TRINITY_DN1976_c0_g2_i3:294-3515(-)
MKNETYQHNNRKQQQFSLISKCESDEDEDEIVQAFSNPRTNLLSSTHHININFNNNNNIHNTSTNTTNLNSSATSSLNTSYSSYNNISSASNSYTNYNNNNNSNFNVANSSYPPPATNLFSQISIPSPLIFERRSILKKEPSLVNFLAQSTQNFPFPKDRKTPEFELKLTRSQDSVFEKRISWGSDITINLGRMSTSSSSTLLHETKSKCDVELKKFLGFIANQLSEQEPMTRENYYKPLQPLVNYAKEMISLSVEEIRGGKCKEIVTNIILYYKNDGALEFYDKQLVTKLLLIISRVSRLVEHLELEEGKAEGQGVLNGATLDDEEDLILDNGDEDNLLPMQLGGSSRSGSSGSSAISPRRSGDVGTPPTSVKKIKGIIAFLVAKVKKWKKDKRARSDSKSSKESSSSSRDISVYSAGSSNDFVDDADFDLRTTSRSRGHSRNISDQQYGSSFTGKSRRKSLIQDGRQFFDAISTKLSNILEQPLSIGTPGKSGGLSSMSVLELLCRICEEMVPANELEDHTKDCAIETQADIRVSNCDYRLDRISKVLARRVRMHKEDSTKWKVVEAFESLLSITQRALDVGIGTNFSVESIRDLVSECQQFIQEPVDLHTQLAKKVVTLLNQKLAIMEDLKTKGYSHRPKKAKRHGITDFNIIKPISKGAFGRVYLAKKKQTGDIYALKVLNKKQTLHKKQVAHITAERNILAATHNPFLVKLYYSFQTRSSLCLVLEYLPGGDLYSLLRALGCFQEEMAKQYIAEVVLALEYLHSLNIIHRDLKPDNLLVDAFGHIKLTDFGLSRYGLLGDDYDYSHFESMHGHGTHSSQSLSSPTTLFISSPTNHFISPTSGLAFGGSGGSDGSKSSNSGGILNSVSWKKAGHVKRYSFVGTPDYLAPEVILGTGHSKQVDWWALGVILFEFITGVPPFNAETPNLVFENIIQRSMTWPEVPDGMSHEAYDLISKLLCVDPNQRLGSKGVHEVKSHPFFAGINWDTLLQQSPSFVPHTSDPHDTSYFDETRQAQMSSCSFKSVSGEFIEGVNDFEEEETEGDGVFIGFSYRNLPNLEALTKQALQSRS